MSETKRCAQCGAPLAAEVPYGLCPACLMKRGLEADTGTEQSVTAKAVPPPAPEELAAHFPELEIQTLLGRGGMGAVYLARQKRLDRTVALKILPPGVGQDPSFAERFEREAKALAKLNHPGIVTLYEFGEADGLYYFLMEYVDGVNLRRLLNAGKLAPKEALAIVPQICDALQFAHDHGIVHRDIKPENILLNKTGQVKIADFGLAKIIGGQSPLSNGERAERAQRDRGEGAGAERERRGEGVPTEPGRVAGTPGYMAPEQVSHPQEVDHRADIYSLGVVFYQMLTGELPGALLEPPSHKVQIDVRLDEVVLRALEKEPARRYQQVSEVKTQVETIVSQSAGRPLPHPALFGYEYRSARTFWGLPLLHVATGFDPATGRRRQARGIIAVGGQARGVLAMGGQAVGVVAFGGIAAGIVALGGLSLGLVSFGGLACALLFAYGGIAVAPLAFGGLALGLYSFGGLAYGLHAAGSNVSDEKVRELFGGQVPLNLTIVFWVLFTLAMVAFGAVMAWSRTRALRVTSHAEGAPHPPAPIRKEYLYLWLLSGFLLAVSLAILSIVAIRRAESISTLGDAVPLPATPPAAARDEAKLEILRLKLRQAEEAVPMAEAKYQAGLVPQTEVMAARDEIAALKAEIAGDALLLARVRLLAALHQFAPALPALAAGAIGPGDFQKIKNDVELREVELHQVEVARNAVPTFGPVIEHVITENAAVIKGLVLFDLSLGLSVQPSVSWSPDTTAAGLLAEVDRMYDAHPASILLSFAEKEWKIDPLRLPSIEGFLDWEMLTPEEVSAELVDIPPPRKGIPGEALKSAPYLNNWSSCYVFRTPDGSQAGVLQLSGTGKDVRPRGVKIRYRFLKQP